MSPHPFIIFGRMMPLCRNANDTYTKSVKPTSNYLKMNLPQAGRVPALPVFLDSSLPPWPRSSVPEWTTTVRCKEVSGRPLRADQLDQLVRGKALAIALSIGLEVAKVANMADLISWSTVCLAMGVDYSILYQPGSEYVCSTAAHSGGRRRCTRWCCHRIDGRACHAQHWGRCQ
jgi:hypothetical protein